MKILGSAWRWKTEGIQQPSRKNSARGGEIEFAIFVIILAICITLNAREFCFADNVPEVQYPVSYVEKFPVESTETIANQGGDRQVPPQPSSGAPGNLPTAAEARNAANKKLSLDYAKAMQKPVLGRGGGGRGSGQGN